MRLSCSLLALITLVAVSGWLVPAQLHAAESDQLHALRQQIAVNRRLNRQVEGTGGGVSELAELMAHSGVMDRDALQQVESILADLERAGTVSLRQTVEALARAVTQQEERDSHVDGARGAQREAILALEQARELAMLRAHRAELAAQTHRIIDQLEQLHQETSAGAQEQLQGEQVENEHSQRLAEDQQRLGDQLEMMAGQLATLDDDMAAQHEEEQLATDMLQPQQAQDLADAARDVAHKLEDQQLLDAATQQQEMLDQLQQLARALDQQHTDQHQAEFDAFADQHTQQLQQLAEQIAQQNEQIENYADDQLGALDERGLAELLADQNELAAQLNDVATDEHQAAQEALAKAQEALAAGDFEQAVDMNQAAQDALQQAIEDALGAAMEEAMAQIPDDGHGEGDGEGEGDEEEDLALRSGTEVDASGHIGQGQWAAAMRPEDRRSLQQGGQEPAPPAYSDHVRRYFIALSKVE